jgi:hypothetical protein
MFTDRMIDISSLPARNLLFENHISLHDEQSAHLKSDVCLLTEYNSIHLKEILDLI